MSFEVVDLGLYLVALLLLYRALSFLFFKTFPILVSVFGLSKKAKGFFFRRSSNKMGLLGTIVIPKNKAGLVFRKSGRGTGNDSVSLNNEPGYQASLLRAGQKYHGYWGWKYDIELVDPITVSHDEIALVVAKQGRKKEPGAIVGGYIPCDDFQNGDVFLKNGGFEGRQSKVLTERQYYINPKLFDVITTSNCHLHGMKPEQLKKIKIEDDVLGVISSLVGRPGKYSEVKDVPEVLHNSYQNIDEFINNGGVKGIQEEVLQTGEYSLNPWCIEVRKVPITHIPNGTVGVVVSHTGTDGAHGADGTVSEGEVGVCGKVLQPRNHAINLGTKKVYIIPTMEITLVWSSGEEKESANNYDVDLKPITILTKDRYPIELKLSQTINIRGEEAPKLISKILDGESMDESITLSERSTKYPAVRKLISRVIKSKIQKHFESISGEYRYLEIGIKRGEIEETALEEIQSVLNEYGVEAKRLSIFVGYDKANPLDRMEQEKAEIRSRSEVDDVTLEAMSSAHGVRVASAKSDTEVDEIVDKAAIDAMARRINLLGANEYIELERLTKLVSMKVEGYPGILVMDSVLSHFKNKVDDTEGSNFDEDKFISRVAESLKNHSIEISHKPKPIEVD